jgi:phosphoglycolate phosphatase-like HAD superfamily hydrolase
VVLWDIDGTLVRSREKRVAVNAFLRALQMTAELPDHMPYPKDSGGKTDEQIALEVLLSSDVAEETALSLLPSFRESYLAELERDRELLMADQHVLPGVHEILARLRDLGVRQSLLTGNLEPIARLKLTAAGLADYVDWSIGAFGSDHRDRTCLVPITRQRLLDQYSSAPAAQDIVVLGDTPRDIACARAGGARAIAVATGHVSRADLAAHAPDALFDDLQDTDTVLTAVLGATAAVH